LSDPPRHRDPLATFELMYRIRSFENVVSRLYRAGDLKGFVHTSIGQEACAVGVCSALGPADFLTSTHRGHGHCIARGMSLDRMAAELYGHRDGYCHGKGGSMHIADPSLGILGANGIVAAGLPIAVGAGLACRLRGQGVAVAFFGEGASTTGAFHESLNLATLWELPVLFACEQNGYVEFTPWAGISKAASVCQLAGGYGLTTRLIDGSDVEVVSATAAELVDGMRAGGGPALLEMTTFRYHGHYEGDFQQYRDAAELALFEHHDPISGLRGRLIANGQATADQLDGLCAGVDAEVADAFEFGRQSPDPDLSELMADV
jgi:TPP-dependent pyruvate/acetoin dehydrogenase alpha subunit